MPLINIYNKKTLLNEHTNFIFNAHPTDWHWDTPVNIKKVKGVHLGYSDQFKNVLYGLFKEQKLLTPICAMDLRLIEIPELGKIPQIEMICTDEKERKKGYASILYEEVLNRHNILLSGEELYTNEGAANNSLGMWLKLMPTLAKVGNFNTKTNEILPFNLNEANGNLDIRFIAIKNVELLNESLKKKVAAGLLGAALLANVSSSDQHQISHKETQPKPTITVQHPAAPQKKLITHVEPKSNNIDIDVIAQIESGNDPSAESPRGAKGLCQLMPDAWKDETKEMFGHSLPEEEMFNGEINKRVGNHYYNVTIPKYLKKLHLPITTDTILASYNYGIGNVHHLFKQYHDQWIMHLPKETKDYIVKYKALDKH